MSINKKVYIIITITFLLLTLTIIGNIAVHFKNYGQKKANESAKLMAKSVRDGLTTLMASNAMDKRALFIDNIAKHGEISNIKVMRSESVIAQYGAGDAGESIYDGVEKSVLSNGKEHSEIIERDDRLFLRVVIPYTATPNSTPDCLSCHNAKKGAVLGAVSMEVDLSDTISEGQIMLLKIAVVSIVFMFASVVVASFYIRPYIRLFDELEDGITQAYHGDFSYKVETKLGGNAGAVAQKLNNLSEIFLFKKTIERDKDKKSVYERIAHILKHNFELKNFWLIEINQGKKEQIFVFASDDDEKEKAKKFCCIDECRAARTEDTVVSTDFENLCAKCLLKHQNYVCMPINLGRQSILILNAEFETKEEVREFCEYTSIVKNYLDTAKPVLESKILMEILEDSSLKDPMTGLFNRRFLDGFVEKELRDNSEYAVLMIDIDFFKMVNDTHGHDIGDKTIKTLAHTIMSHIKGSDVAIRYGGEEFMVVLFDLNRDTAFKIAETIRVDFASKRIDTADGAIQKTVSIGIAMHTKESKDHWKTIKYADDALYAAKRSGRDRSVFFETAMHSGGVKGEY